MIPTSSSRNDSNHSTIAVEAPAPAKQEEATRRRKSARRVCFNEQRNEYREDQNRQRCSDDFRKTWYTRKDYKRFNDSMQRVIRKAIEAQETREENNETVDDEENSLSAILSGLFDATTSVKEILEDASQLKKKDSAVAKLCKLLSKQRRRHVELIGLEYHISQHLCQEARSRRDSIQDVVYDIQAEYDRGLWSAQEVDEELQECCENYSQASSLFAQLLAQAQLRRDGNV